MTELEMTTAFEAIYAAGFKAVKNRHFCYDGRFTSSKDTEVGLLLSDFTMADLEVIKQHYPKYVEELESQSRKSREYYKLSQLFDDVFRDEKIQSTNNSFYDENGMPLSYDRVLSLIHNYSDHYREDHPKTIVPASESVRHELDSRRINTNRENHQILQETIKYNPAYTKYSEQSLVSLMDYMGVPEYIENPITHEKIYNYRKACVRAFQHWLWQIKRLLIVQREPHPVILTYQLFLHLYSPIQGNGKSYLIEHRLCAPLKSLFYPTTLEVLTDSRDNGLWTEYYVIFFDELSVKSGSSRLYIKEELLTNLKANITAHKATHRIMKTTEHEMGLKKGSAISTGNCHLAQNFSDESGMRRFFEIECHKDKFDQDKINSIDWVQVWQGVDENSEWGFYSPEANTEDYNLIRSIQHTYQNYTPLHAYIDEGYNHGKEPFVRDGENLTGQEVERRVPDVYHDYCEYLEENGTTKQYKLQRNTLIDKLMSINIKKVGEGKKLAVYTRKP
jgi:hypothetical protein